MKTALRHTFFALATALLATGTAAAQIDFYDNFAGDTSRWLTQDFETTGLAVCGNDLSFIANPSNLQDVAISVEAVSPRLGISDGERVTLTYNYKLVDYNEVLPANPVDDSDWGVVTVDYGPTINGPWTEIDRISPLNHFPTNECTTRAAAFTPANGSEVYLRLRAEPGTSQSLNYLVYIDDVNALQDISGSLTQNSLQVYPNPVTDYLNLSYNGILSDILIFDRQGIQVPPNDVEVNGNRLDMSGLPFGEYTLKLTIDNRVTSVDITKN